MAHAEWLSPLVNPKDLMKTGKILSEAILGDMLIMKYDFIAVCGVSGLAVGGLVSALTGIPLVIVRQTRGNHSAEMVEYSEDLTGATFCIVDDLIDSGATVNHIADMINSNVSIERDRMHNYLPVLKKCYMYRGMSDKEVSVKDFDGNEYTVSAVTTRFRS